MVYISNFGYVRTKKITDKVLISLDSDPPQWWEENKNQIYKFLRHDQYTTDVEFKAYLDSHNALNFINKILRMSHNKNAILVVYEEWRNKFLKDWLIENGYECEDYIYEDQCDSKK